MTRRREGKSEREVFPQVRDADIPDWVREVEAPSSDLPALFTWARYGRPFDFEPYDEYLVRLSARAKELFQTEVGGARYVLQLLDLVPWFILEPVRFPWLQAALKGFFTYRAYSLLDDVPARQHRAPSADRQRALILMDYYRAQGLSYRESIDRVADDTASTPEAVEKRVTRAKADPLLRQPFPSRAVPADKRGEPDRANQPCFGDATGGGDGSGAV